MARTDNPLVRAGDCQPALAVSLHAGGSWPRRAISAFVANLRRILSCSTGWRASLRPGWRLKPIHRLIVTSATYGSRAGPIARTADADPENALLGRMDSPPARRGGCSRRDAGRLWRVEPEDGRTRRAGAPGERGYGPDLHRGGGGRSLAGGPRPHASTCADRSIYFASGMSAIPCSSRLILPMRSFPVPAARPAPTPSRHSTCSTATLPATAPGPWRAGSSARREAVRTSVSDARIAWCCAAIPRRGSKRGRGGFWRIRLIVRREIAEGRPVSEPSGPGECAIDRALAAAWVDLALAMLNSNEFLYIP